MACFKIQYPTDALIFYLTFYKSALFFFFKEKKKQPTDLVFLNRKILEAYIHVAVSLKVMPRDITGHLKRAGNLRYFVKTHANE